MPTVLIIDDNAAVAIALDVLFSLHEIDSLRAASPEEGLALLQDRAIDLVIQDMNFTADTTSGEEGVALFHAIRARHPDLPVILLTAWTQQDAATERVVHLACQVARADVSVLISGPNGSGKERIAAIVQANSAVRDGPFVVLNCGAVPVDLIEAELFGAEAGAYTGSTRARDGKFDAADGGTLFLDEIGNLPLAGQMKLLRVLETGRFERLGSNRERHVKVRVISATNADLAAMIRAGSFR